MTRLTITEALAERKTIVKRIEKKREFCKSYLVRPQMIRDPLEKDGGTFAAISRETQAIRDLAERDIAILRAIHKANAETPVTVAGETRTIEDWLAWRKDVGPGSKRMLEEFRALIQGARNEMRGKIAKFREKDNESEIPVQLEIGIDEGFLSTEIERLETALSSLDGQLSLKNATTFVEF